MEATLSSSTWGLYSRDFFADILANAHGSLLDLLVVGVVLLWFQKQSERKLEIRHNQETISDLRSYRGEDVAYRVYGAVKRLVSLQCFSIDLAEANLTNINYTGIRLEKSNFRAANFSGAILTKSEFDDCEGDAAIFVGAKLRHIKFHKVRLRRAKFSNADLAGCDFSTCNIEGADFSGANLRSAIFREVDCRKVTFKDADLRSANFVGAKNLTAEALGTAKNSDYIKQ